LHRTKIAQFGENYFSKLKSISAEKKKYEPLHQIVWTSTRPGEVQFVSAALHNELDHC